MSRVGIDRTHGSPFFLPWNNYFFLNITQNCVIYCRLIFWENSRNWEILYKLLTFSLVSDRIKKVKAHFSHPKHSSQNCEFNSEKTSLNCEMQTDNWQKKISELWDKKSQLHFFFIIPWWKQASIKPEMCSWNFSHLRYTDDHSTLERISACPMDISL